MMLEEKKEFQVNFFRFLFTNVGSSEGLSSNVNRTITFPSDNSDTGLVVWELIRCKVIAVDSL